MQLDVEVKKKEIEANFEAEYIYHEKSILQRKYL